jgi:hypothetical protein
VKVGDWVIVPLVDDGRDEVIVYENERLNKQTRDTAACFGSS